MTTASFEKETGSIGGGTAESKSIIKGGGVISRRAALLRASAVLPVAMLAACGLVSESTTNGVNTFVVDTKTLSTDGAALVAAASSLLAFPVVTAALGPDVVVALAALAAAKDVMATISSATGGSLTTTISLASAQGFVTSLLTDIGQIVTLVSNVAGSLGSAATQAVVASVQSYLAAIGALVPFVQLAVNLVTAASVTKVVGLTEAQALQIATH